MTLAAGLLSGCGGQEPAGPAGTTTDAGGGYGGPPAGGSQEASDVVIVISDFTYELPGPVPAGATITVRNEDGVGHTVTSDDGAFDVAVGPGEETTLTAPDEPGDYPFHCTPHPQMTATLTVEG